MTPKDFAKKCPKLLHLTRTEALPLIREHGLLTASDLCRLFEVEYYRQAGILSSRRPKNIKLEHEVHGTVVISDNTPLYLGSLEKCLEDGLTTEDWLQILNKRVFFFSKEKDLKVLAAGQGHREVAHLILEINTLSFVKDYITQISVAAINTGSAKRKAPHRGLATFAPLETLDFDAWKYSRGNVKPDYPKEVSVLGSIPNIFDYVEAVTSL